MRWHGEAAAKRGEIIEQGMSGKWARLRPGNEYASPRGRTRATGQWQHGPRATGGAPRPRTHGATDGAAEVGAPQVRAPTTVGGATDASGGAEGEGSTARHGGGRVAGCAPRRNNDPVADLWQIMEMDPAEEEDAAAMDEVRRMIPLLGSRSRDSDEDGPDGPRSEGHPGTGSKPPGRVCRKPMSEEARDRRHATMIKKLYEKEAADKAAKEDADKASNDRKFVLRTMVEKLQDHNGLDLSSLSKLRFDRSRAAATCGFFNPRPAATCAPCRRPRAQPDTDCVDFFPTCL